ncbi:MAG: hypothetical protein RIQ41_563, partial [Candidatus Parcubacteria bacterium]
MYSVHRLSFIHHTTEGIHRGHHVSRTNRATLQVRMGCEQASLIACNERLLATAHQALVRKEDQRARTRTGPRACHQDRAAREHREPDD